MEEIQFKRPEIEDRELIESYFRKYPSRSCERTFVNVFLWSRHYKVTFAEIEHTIDIQIRGSRSGVCLSGRSRGGCETGA